MSNRRNDNNPYSKFSNKDYDFVSKKINYDKSIISNFFNLILLGEISKLDSFLLNYPYLNKTLSSEEDSPYHVIVESNLSNHKKINLIKYLHSKNFNLNVQNKMGDTPLLIASKQFNINIINTLIDLGANINISNYLDINPIHYIFKGSVKQCENLKIEPIIDEPNVKFDRVLNSENFKEAKSNFVKQKLNELLIDQFDLFEGYINSVLKSKRFEYVFQQIKDDTVKQIKDNLSNKFKNEKEKKNELQKIIRLASKNVNNKIISLTDNKIFYPIDFTPSFNLKKNNTGLKYSDDDEYYYIDSRPTFSQYLQGIGNIIKDNDGYKNIKNKIESYDIKENVKKVIDDKITFDFTKDILQRLVELEATFLELIGFDNLSPLIGGDMKPSLTDLVPSKIKELEPIILSIPKDANIRAGKRIQIITESNPNPFVYELISDNNGIRIIKDIIITLKDENKLEIEFKYFEEFENLRNENNKKRNEIDKEISSNNRKIERLNNEIILLQNLPSVANNNKIVSKNSEIDIINNDNIQLNAEKVGLEVNQDLINPSKFEADYYKIKLEGIINVNGSDETINKDFSFDIKSQQDYFKKITDQNVENFEELGNKFFQSGGLPDEIEDKLKLNLKLLRSKFAQFTELNKVLEKYFEKVNFAKIDMTNNTVTKNIRNINKIFKVIKDKFLKKLAGIIVDNTNKSNELDNIHNDYISKLKILTTTEKKKKNNLDKLDVTSIPPVINYDNDENDINNRNSYPEEFNDFFYTFRYSMFEVFLKDEESRNKAFPEDLVNNVKDMIDELVELDEKILLPTVYSIICDYYDNIIINNLKNKFNEIIKSKFENELSNVTFFDYIGSTQNINSDLVDLDVNFGLDISKSEDEIYNFVNKKIENFDEKLVSFGQILTANKRNVVFDTDDKGTTHIFYPQDFLVSIKSPTMCTSYNEDLLNKVLDLNTDFNLRDIYGNNILFYAINSQNYLAIQKIKNKLGSDFERLLKTKNNEKEPPIKFCEKKLNILENYFADNDLNILGKISSFYENDLKDNIENIDIHKNVLKNYELIPFIPLYLIHINTIAISTPVATPTPVTTPTPVATPTPVIEYEYLPTPISTPTEMSLNESKKLMEKFKSLKSENISFFDNLNPGKFREIISKNSLSRKTKENEMLNNEFKIVCFTIDHILGKSLLNVLKRLTYTFFKYKYPSANVDDNYVKFIKSKLEDKFRKIESYITSDDDFETYEPSEYTKRVVSIHGDYKLNEYTDDSEVEIFEYIIENIKENGEVIDNNEPVIEHITRVVQPYFFSYYNTAIKTIQNCISGYENYVSNYIILKQIINLLN